MVLDSPWETHYNTFVPSPSRYPDFAAMVGDLNAQGVRTVLWITSLVNETSFDAEPGGDTYLGASPNFVPGRGLRRLIGTDVGSIAASGDSISGQAVVELKSPGGGPYALLVEAKQ